jgi:hypothetical protein
MMKKPLKKHPGCHCEDCNPPAPKPKGPLPICDSRDPETGVKCGQPAGHERWFQCSNRNRSWTYNPPKAKAHAAK